MRYVPHPYQRTAYNWIMEHERCGLFLDMGLGKTVITLTAVRDLIDSLDVEKVLVIAPKRVAEDTWSRESQKWDHLRTLRISKVLGCPADRKRAMRAEADAVDWAKKDAAAQALQRTCHEQEAHIRHDGTERGGQCEERRPQEKDAPLAETVCHLAHRQQEYDGGEQKNLEHPAEFISRDAVSESDIRQRERQGTARERRHEGRHHHGQQDLLAIRQSHTIT